MGKKLTIDFVKNSFEKEDYSLLSKKYINAKTKLEYICLQGHKHSITWSNWKSGYRCPYCVGLAKPTMEFVKESFEKESYILLSNEYINAYTKLEYICPEGHRHSIIWSSWNQGNKCPSCASNYKLTIEFIKESFEKEGYKLLSKEYVNSKTKLDYICPEGHEHSMLWNNWSAGHKCPTCAGLAKSTIEFVKESFEKESYILLNEEYKNSKTKLDYICPKGHKHNVRWSDWQIGNRCPTCFKNNNKGQNHPSWKGGVAKRDVPLYDTYTSQIDFCEKTRRDPNELDLLQVECTKCGEWYNPTMKSVVHRVYALNNINNGEGRFYCSDECKHSCSIFGKHKYAANEIRSKTNPNFTSSELNIWSQEVLKRADYICEYCGAVAEHAHHIQPKKLEPFFALDPDNGIACCEECHYKYGHRNGCSTGVLANIIC